MFNLDKKSYLFCLVCFAITLFSVYVVYFVVTLPKVDIDYNKAKNQQIIMCAAKFKGNKTHLNLDVVRNNDELVFTTDSVDSWESQLVMSASILMQCKGMDVEYICLGSSCASGGMELELSFDESMVDERIKRVSN